MIPQQEEIGWKASRDKVAIVGMGCSKFGERWDAGVEDLLVEAAYEAFEDAGIGPEAIQAAWIGTVFSGMSAVTMSPLGLQYIPMTRVENMCATASEALRAASYAVASGACDIALAIGVEKLKDAGTTGLKGPAIVGDNTDGSSAVGPGYSAPGVLCLSRDPVFRALWDSARGRQETPGGDRGEKSLQWKSGPQSAFS